MSLAVHPETWKTKLSKLIPTHEIEKNKRYHYLCQTVQFDWRRSIPEGYEVHRVDRALLNRSSIFFPETSNEWMDFKEMWWTVDNFLAMGVSFCVLHEGEVVSWCTPDCVSRDRMDVGIITHPTHRRQGLGSIAVAATVEYCLATVSAR
jgi:RimJ/RimL family protein N-acetyltransferase